MSDDPRVPQLHDLLAVHEPATPREAASLRTFRRYATWLRRPFDEHDDPVHVTSSAIVLDASGRTLLHLHKRLGLWLQPGGHVDPDEAPPDGALREAREETGIPLTHPPGGPQMIHVDVHEGGRGHLHLDLRYLLLGDATAAFAPAPGESARLRWVSLDEARTLSDASVTEAVTAAHRAAG